MKDSTREKFIKAGQLANEGKLKDARTLLDEVLKEAPDNSEAWRQAAQIDWQHNGLVDKAYDELIESLKLDPKNVWALILMGNLLSQEKKDVKSADEYYKKVLEYHSDNVTAINNIGSMYMKNNLYNEAIDYFQKAIDADKTFMNSYLGMALCMKAQGRNLTAFNICVDGMKIGKDRKENPIVRQQLGKLMMQLADILCGMTKFDKVYETLRKGLEDYGEHPIILMEDKSLSINAQMEYHL